MNAQTKLKSPNHELIGDCDDTHLSTLAISSATLSILDSFVGHGLKDLNNAALMDRVDTKYLIPIERLQSLLTNLLPHYSALEINKKRVFTYHNTYFDTEQHDLYHAHHQGKLNRYKVRHRNYVDSKRGFLEVKFKNNKGRTIKSRIESTDANVTDFSQKTFLDKKLDERFSSLKASQWGGYERIALANEKCGERLTLDMNLTFQSMDESTRVSFPKFFIAELKQNKHDLQSPFAQEMSKMGIRPNKFSKYCMGCAVISPMLKQNRFKPLITMINKFT